MIKTVYKVQVGAYEVKENAEKMAKKLKEAGFNATIIQAQVELPDEEDKKISGYKLVEQELNKYLDSKTARQDIIKNFNEYAKKVGNIRLRTDKDSLCSETVISAFYKAGLIDLIGKGCTGCGNLISNAKKLGTWYKGSSDIKPGDIVLYGKDSANHTEFAIDSKYNISGQYKDGGVHKRVRAGRTIYGHIRPKY